MAFPSPGAIAEVLQKIYEVARAIKTQVDLYKNIGPRLNVLSLDLVATADIVERTPLADKKQIVDPVQHLMAFLKEAECIINVLKAQKTSIFGRLRTFVLAGSINSKIDDLDVQLRKFQSQYKLLELDNLNKTVATLARATPADLISIIPGVEASVFWKDNFQNEIVVGESRVKSALLHSVRNTNLYSETDLNAYFDSIWHSMIDDMDANGDDFITIFEYRAYVEDGTMLEQFEHLWQAAGHQLTRKTQAIEETLPSIGKRKSEQSAAPRAPPSSSSVSAQVALVDSNLRKKAEKEMGVDIAFVVDCTSSMGDWIDAVKNKVSEIHRLIANDHPLVRQRFAFVGYRDFNDGNDRFETHNFTSSIDTLKEFLRNVKAKASGKTDTPEDVLGGLKSMLRLNWRADVRIAILLGDAPCHGVEYYIPTDNNGKPVPAAKFDYYPNGDPEKNDPKAIIEQVADDKVHLVLCRIPNPTRGVITDIMIDKFKTFYATRCAKNRDNRQATVVNLQDSASLFVSKILEPLNKAMDENVCMSVHSRRQKASVDVCSVLPSSVPSQSAQTCRTQTAEDAYSVIPSSVPQQIGTQIDSVIPSTLTNQPCTSQNNA